MKASCGASFTCMICGERRWCNKASRGAIAQQSAISNGKNGKRLWQEILKWLTTQEALHDTPTLARDRDDRSDVEHLLVVGSAICVVGIHAPRLWNIGLYY